MPRIEMCHQNWQDRPVRIDQPSAALHKADEPEKDADVEEEERIEQSDGMCGRPAANAAPHGEAIIITVGEVRAALLVVVEEEGAIEDEGGQGRANCQEDVAEVAHLLMLLHFPQNVVTLPSSLIRFSDEGTV